MRRQRDELAEMAEALRSGPDVEAFAAARARLAELIMVAEPKELPALLREWRLVVREQGERGVPAVVSIVDRLRERRDKRSG